jgi:hypothetical protein
MSDQFRNYDAKPGSTIDPNAVRIVWTREEVDDDSHRTFEDYDGHEEGSEDEAAARERWSGYERGEWSFIGVRAKAEIHVPIGGGSFCIYTVTSPGLWGVESDSGEEYLASVYEDEKAELAANIRRFAEGLEGEQ